MNPGAGSLAPARLLARACARLSWSASLRALGRARERTGRRLARVKRVGRSGPTAPETAALNVERHRDPLQQWRAAALRTFLGVGIFSVFVNLLMLTMPIYLFQISDRVLTSRVFGTYVSEGMALLEEGVAPALIDKAGLIAGMPVGPLALADEVSIELVHKIASQTKSDLGDKYVERSADRVAARMVEGLGRLGRKSGHGFYEYPADGKKRLWAGLAEHFPVKAEQPSVEEIVERLIAIQSVETARCLEEKVLRAPIDADVGAILGWGYPPFRGGPIGWIHTVGIGAFVAVCNRLAERNGERFRAPSRLTEMAEKGEHFYPV